MSSCECLGLILTCLLNLWQNTLSKALEDSMDRTLVARHSSQINVHHVLATESRQLLPLSPPHRSGFILLAMASSVDAKLLKSTKFPAEFSQKVDMQKVNVEVMKK